MLDQATKAVSGDLFKFLLDLEGRKAVRHAYYFSVLIVQLDRSENHKFLPTLFYLIRQSVRATDLIGKMGDRRFSVILHESESPDSHGVGDRICSRVATYNFESRNTRCKRTVSVGGACFPTHTPDTQSLLLTAEKMLEQARSRGGNRICLPDR
jgi:diguanylate cyclase (GGDEF)-like protein